MRIPLSLSLSPQLSQCEAAVKALEREIARHQRDWEEAQATINHHQNTIATMSSQHEKLQVQY